MDRRLRQFLVVAETGNVSLAAEMLHVTQPTISVNLSKLEVNSFVTGIKGGAKKKRKLPTDDTYERTGICSNDGSCHTCGGFTCDSKPEGPLDSIPC